MLVGVCAVSVVLVRAVPVLCLVDGVQVCGAPVLGGMLRGRFSRLVAQKFGEVGLVRRGQGSCMMGVFVGAVGELFRCLRNDRPLHVRRRDMGVVCMGA